MIRNAILPHVATAFTMLALAGCAAEPADDQGPAPSPILYEIADSEGDTEGWLFGTIHALPDGIEWNTPALDGVIDQADYLVVEVAELEDRDALAETFATLSFTPNLPALPNRIDEAQRPALCDLISRSDFAASDFNSVETWAAALMLAQVGTQGDPANGVDRAVIREFENRRVHELEGAAEQLSIFDALPETDQRDLLVGVVTEARQLQDDPGRLRRAWLAGDREALTAVTQSGIMADAELREALLTGRNREWFGKLATMLEENEKPLIAVGAAHLVGPDGLPTLLEQGGYTIKTLQ